MSVYLVHADINVDVNLACILVEIGFILENNIEFRRAYSVQFGINMKASSVYFCIGSMICI